jgi:hypothetical protein
MNRRRSHAARQLRLGVRADLGHSTLRGRDCGERFRRFDGVREESPIVVLAARNILDSAQSLGVRDATSKRCGRRRGRAAEGSGCFGNVARARFGASCARRSDPLLVGHAHDAWFLRISAHRNDNREHHLRQLAFNRYPRAYPTPQIPLRARTTRLTGTYRASRGPRPIWTYGASRTPGPAWTYGASWTGRTAR